MAKKLDLPGPAALVEFKSGISTSQKTQGQHYLSLFINQQRVARVSGLGRDALKVRALKEWMCEQFRDALRSLAHRAYTEIPYSGGKQVPFSKWRTNVGDLRALIRLEQPPGSRLRYEIDIDTGASFEDVRALLTAVGYRMDFSKSASKERIDYYMLYKEA